MAERRCVIQQGFGFFDQGKLVPTDALAKHLDEAGADTWFPNPKKDTTFALPAPSSSARVNTTRDDLWPVWGTFHYSLTC